MAPEMGTDDKDGMKNYWQLGGLLPLCDESEGISDVNGDALAPVAAPAGLLCIAFVTGAGAALREAPRMGTDRCEDSQDGYLISTDHITLIYNSKAEEPLAPKHSQLNMKTRRFV
jgi:hypothetical protein